MKAPQKVPETQYDLSPILCYIHRIDGVVWDLDGTLIINNEAFALDQIGSIFKQFLKASHGITDHKCYRRYAGMPVKQIRHVVGVRHGVNLPASLDTDIAQARTLCPLPDEPIVVHPFFRGLLDIFHEHKIPQRIATGSEIDRALRYVKAANLTHYFTTEDSINRALKLCKNESVLHEYTHNGVDNWLFHGKKPKEDCYLMAIASMRVGLNAFDVDEKRILAFEDSASGVSAGHAARTHVIGHQLAEHLPKNGTARDNHHVGLFESGASAAICNTETAVHTVECVLCQDFGERSQSEAPARKLRLVPTRQTANCA